MGREGNHQRTAEHFKETQHQSQQPGGQTGEQQVPYKQPGGQPEEQRDQSHQTGDQIRELQDQYHQFGGLTWDKQDRSQQSDDEWSSDTPADKDALKGELGIRGSIAGNTDQGNQSSTDDMNATTR